MEHRNSLYISQTLGYLARLLNHSVYLLLFGYTLITNLMH